MSARLLVWWSQSQPGSPLAWTGPIAYDQFPTAQACAEEADALIVGWWNQYQAYVFAQVLVSSRPDIEPDTCVYQRDSSGAYPDTWKQLGGDLASIQSSHTISDPNLPPWTGRTVTGREDIRRSLVRARVYDLGLELLRFPLGCDVVGPGARFYYNPGRPPWSYTWNGSGV